MKKTIALVLTIIAMIGCKPVHTVQEKRIVSVDSTAVFALQEVLDLELKKNESLRTELNRAKEENLKLTNEIESHEIHYDTTAKVDSVTGKYPIASETITTSKSVLEREIKEQEKLLKEQDIEIRAQAQLNKNLEYQVENLKTENSELKSKTTKCGFSFKWLIYGIVSGSILTILVLALWKMK